MISRKNYWVLDTHGEEKLAERSGEFGCADNPDRFPRVDHSQSVVRESSRMLTLRSLGSSRVVFRYVVAVLIPLVLIPVATIGTKESRCAYVMLLMAFYWVLEPVPIAVTSLFPVVFFPLLDILSTADACAPYMSSTNMIFLAGLMMAVAIEHCRLHQRIALKVLLVVGTSTRRLLVGFMSSSAFLSMWISNTASTAMMVPIVEAVIVEIRKEASDRKTNGDVLEMKEEDGNGTSAPSADEGAVAKVESGPSEVSILRKGLLLSVAYSANIGGTGTLIGTGPNLVLQGVLSKKYPDSNDITFASWMLYAIPGMVVCLVLAWLLIYLMFLRKSSNDQSSASNIRTILQRKYDELGPVNFHQGAVIFLFVTMIVLLFFQEPKFIPGWAPAIAKVKIKDATPAVAVVIFLFLIPSNPRRLGSSPALLEWKVVQDRVPWGILLLLGGGFSMAYGFQQSGLSNWVKSQLTGLRVLSADALLVVISLITATLTELTSNTTTATAFLPVVADLALVLSTHPLFLMLPVAIACSFAFMLPIATPPNAIVYEAANMKTRDMALPGFIMNILCCGVSYVSVNTVGVALFDLRRIPTWAGQTMDNVTSIAANVTMVR